MPPRHVPKENSTNMPHVTDPVSGWTAKELDLPTLESPTLVTQAWASSQLLWSLKTG